MKTTRFGGVSLQIAVARQIAEALANAKVLKCFDGPQRRRIDETIEQLEAICVENESPEVMLPVHLVVDLLLCISSTQEWFGNMLDEFGQDVD